VRPKLALDFDASYTAASPTSRPSVAFTVQNTGRFPLSIVGVDTRMAGLSGARVTIAQFGPEGELGPRHGFPLTLTGGGHAHITLTYASWKCQAIEFPWQRHGSDSLVRSTGTQRHGLCRSWISL